MQVDLWRKQIHSFICSSVQFAWLSISTSDSGKKNLKINFKKTIAKINTESEPYQLSQQPDVVKVDIISLIYVLRGIPLGLYV